MSLSADGPNCCDRRAPNGNDGIKLSVSTRGMATHGNRKPQRHLASRGDYSGSWVISLVVVDGSIVAKR